jgi:hypothetical protein
MEYIAGLALQLFLNKTLKFDFVVLKSESG